MTELELVDTLCRRVAEIPATSTLSCDGTCAPSRRSPTKRTSPGSSTPPSPASPGSTASTR